MTLKIILNTACIILGSLLLLGTIWAGRSGEWKAACTAAKAGDINGWNARTAYLVVGALSVIGVACGITGFLLR